MIGSAFLAFFVGIFGVRFVARTGQGFGAELRRAQFAKLQSLDQEARDKFAVSSLITRLTNDTYTIQNAIIIGMRGIFRAPFMITIVLMLSFNMNSKVAIVFAFTLPLIAVSSVMGGYFTAVQRIVKFSSSQIFENLVRIFVVMILLNFVPAGNLEYACAAVSVGNVLGEILSVALIMLLYFFDVRQYGKERKKHPGMTRRMLHIALPMAFSAYARTALGTLQHLLVPKGLQKSGASPEAALSAYGTISGMVLPVVLFPIAIFTSVSEMIVPDLTEAQMRGDSALCSRIVNRTLSICLFFSIGVFGVFFAFARELGLAVYSSATPGYFIRIFSPLVIVMYMDTVTDGMLKGLGQQMHSMVYNIIDALSSVIMVYFLLPRYAVTAYVFTIFFTETLNFALSIRRLTKVVGVSVPLRDISLPFICIAGAVNFALLLLRLLGLPISPSPLVIAVHMLVTLLFYYILLRLVSCLTSSDVRRFATLFKQ